MKAKESWKAGIGTEGYRSKNKWSGTLVRAEWPETAGEGRDKQRRTRQNVSKRQVVLNL